MGMQIRTRAEDARPATPGIVRTTVRQDAVTVALSTWLMIGLFVDGWAHNNLARLETFFTPWHALFYSGFTATALWVLRLVTRNLRPGGDWRAAVPAGYGLGLAGLGMFAVGGGSDLVWHTLLGIEVSIDALLSPPHLLLFAGMALILTSPLRAAWSRSGDRPGFAALLPAILSATLLTSLVSFFFMYTSAFLSWEPTRGFARFLETLPPEARDAMGNGQSRGVTAIVLTNLIVLGPLLYLTRRWRLPFGAATVLITVVATLTLAIDAFERPELAVAALVSGLLADLLIARLEPSRERRGAFLATAGLLPLALWVPHLATLALYGGVAWPVELWAGVVVMSAFGGLALGLLMAPAPVPETEPAS
jgi:hypothetical protein